MYPDFTYTPMARLSPFACRGEVRESKVIVARPWTEAKARAAILRFLRGRPSAYVSDIMEALGMEPEFAFRMVDALAKEGRIR
jgi:hypothetical protein